MEPTIRRKVGFEKGLFYFFPNIQNGCCLLSKRLSTIVCTSTTTKPMAGVASSKWDVCCSIDGKLEVVSDPSSHGISSKQNWED